MSAHARRGALLAIVATLLVANPAYLGFVLKKPRPRNPTGYAATAVNPANATDQRLLIREVGGDDVVSVSEVASANQYQPYGDAYEAPERAADVLREAVRTGTAHTNSSAVAFTLHRVAANYPYVAVEHGGDGNGNGNGDGTQYYRVAVESNGTGAVVTATATDRAAVARHVLYHDVRLYSSLPEYQRETVRKVVDAGEYGYRPYNDQFVELTDDVVRKDGTYYVFSEGIHADDFGPSTRGLVSIVLSLLGVLSLCGAVAFTLLDYRRDAG